MRLLSAVTSDNGPDVEGAGADITHTDDGDKCGTRGAQHGQRGQKGTE